MEHKETRGFLFVMLERQDAIMVLKFMVKTLVVLMITFMQEV